MKIQRRRGPVRSVDDIAPLDDTELSEVSESADNGSDIDEVVEEIVFQSDGNGARDTNGTNGAGNGHSARPNGSGAIMLPKRRRRTEPRTVTPSAATTAAIATDTADAAIEAAPLVPGRRRWAAFSSDATSPTAPAPALTPGVADETAPDLAPSRKDWRLYITYENIFWVSLFILTIVTRFWDLAPRGIHHDESLHAHFSRLLYDGSGYIHDPMMHGPLQFHLIAAMYWLFGTTDATARFASVFCGIFVVMSPFFLRKQMGRLASVICAALLFISPSILYFSRMAREDAIFSGMEMIMLVGLWRFVSQRKPTDFVIFCAGLALMFTIKETSYLTLLIVAVFFLVLFAVQAGYAVLAALGGYVGALGLMYLFVSSGMKAGTIPHVPNIPQVSPNFDIIWQFMGGFFAHPLVIGVLALTALFVAGVTVMLRSQRGVATPAFATGDVAVRRTIAGNGVPTRRVTSSSARVDGSANGHETAESASPEVVTTDTVAAEEVAPNDDASPVYDPRAMEPSPGSATGRYQPGSIPHLIGGLFSRPSVLIIGLLVALAIYLVFYTVFFTDIPRGIISGIFGSLGYWMAQHDVRRGDQPWFYYFLLIPLYEPIAVFFSLAATTFFSWRGVRWLVRRVRGDVGPSEPAPQRLGWFNTDRAVPFASFSAFLPLFLIVWLFGTVSIYSWAGEKMPWLMVHMVRPAIFLASLFLAALVISLLRRRQERMALAQESGRGFVTTYEPVAIENGGARGSALPARRRSGALLIEQPVMIEQEPPPWVTWNRPGSRFPLVLYLTAFVVLTLAWGLKLNGFTHFSRYDDWGYTWIFPLLILLATAGYAVWIGPGRALRYLGLGILSVGLMYQFRSTINLSYNNPDVPTELATYVQTSPHVVSALNNLETLSKLTSPALSYPGGVQQGPKRSTKVIYDSFTSWPMEWYLRDYDKQFISSGEANPGPDVPVMFLEYAKHTNKPNLTDNYVAIRYPMRWWFPQEWYMDEFIPNRYFTDEGGGRVTDPESGKLKENPLLVQTGGALNTIRATIAEPRLQATLWKYLTFRETPKPLGSEDMLVFVRKDVAQLWFRTQYEPPATPSDVLPRALPEREWWLTDVK